MTIKVFDALFSKSAQVPRAAPLVAEGIILPFARVNFQNSPVDCFGKRDALAESVPKPRF